MKLTIEKAKQFAEEKFKTMQDLNCKANLSHAKCMIKAINELTEDEEIIDKLTALAWVHDIGKTLQKEDHARIGLEILEKKFDLDESEKDCILNHGTPTSPKTELGKLFRYSDGISLFYPETFLFRFWIESKKGLSHEDVVKKMKKLYEKYAGAYTNNAKALDILKQRASCFLVNNIN